MRLCLWVKSDELKMSHELYLLHTRQSVDLQIMETWVKMEIFAELDHDENFFSDYYQVVPAWDIEN